MTVEEALLISESLLKYRCLNKVQEIVFRQAWEGRSYRDIAKSSGYEACYIKDAGSKLWQLLSKAFGEKVTKNNLQSVVKRYAQRTQAVASVQAISLSTTDVKENDRDRDTDSGKCQPSFEETLGVTFHQDWGEAIDVSVFYGRSAELIQLEQWIVQERCRLVALLGIGGIGKTALAVKLAERIQENFEFVIWRSLRNAPPLEDLLTDLLQFLSHGQDGELPNSVDGKLLRLIKYLRSSRCLLVLDRAETILESGELPRKSDRDAGVCHQLRFSHPGQYRQGYEGYGELFRCVGETRHRSCLMLTSREKPIDLAFLEGNTLPIRSLQLSGLNLAEGKKIVRDKGNFLAREDEWRTLIEHCKGNPLALKIVAAGLRDSFDSNLSQLVELLAQGRLVFEDISNLLER